MSINDLSFYRDDMEVSFIKNDSNSKLIESNYKFNIRLPFPEYNENDGKDFIFRILFKPETGKLWGFHQFYIDNKLFHQINFADILNPKNDEYSKNLKSHSIRLGTITNNSREDIPDEDIMNTEGMGYLQSQGAND